MTQDIMFEISCQTNQIPVSACTDAGQTAQASLVDPTFL